MVEQMVHLVRKLIEKRSWIGFGALLDLGEIDETSGIFSCFV